MAAEISALMDAQTWTLVPPPPNQNIICCKQIYRVKQKADGTVNRFKAWPVAKGFTQQSGIDYEDIFSPVTKSSTIRLVLVVATQFNWPMKQLDINNAFLHDYLK